MRMLSKSLNGRGKLFSGFLDPTKSTTGSSHERLDQLLLISNFKYIGSEKRGGESVYMAGPGSLEVVFSEDNQATIRILESGRSPSFKLDTDKTQRLNLSCG